MWLKYSDAPIFVGEQWDRVQPTELSTYTKPSGFWITDDSEDCWRSWCVSSDFSLEALTFKHEITLDESNILILHSVGELDYFTHEFKTFKWWGGPDERKYRDTCIDWPKVAQQYDGLIITPYQWRRRLHDGYSWYSYGWDCASGCIWKAGAILDIRLIEVDREIAKPREEEAA